MSWYFRLNKGQYFCSTSSTVERKKMQMRKNTQKYDNPIAFINRIKKFLFYNLLQIWNHFQKKVILSFNLTNQEQYVIANVYPWG